MAIERDVVFSDIHKGFVQDASGHVKIVEDLDSIDQALNTILLFPLGSRKFLRTFGSRIQEVLFEPMTEGSALELSAEIQRALTVWDDRLELSVVQATPDYDNHGYEVSIVGSVRGLGEFSYSRIISAE